jgi:hypothetical protein
LLLIFPAEDFLLGLLAAAIDLLHVAGHGLVYNFLEFSPSFLLVLPTPRFCPFLETFFRMRSLLKYGGVLET